MTLTSTAPLSWLLLVGTALPWYVAAYLIHGQAFIDGRYVDAASGAETALAAAAGAVSAPSWSADGTKVVYHVIAANRSDLILDGRLFVDGRDDEMIVSGGENVFPKEVEDLLAAVDQAFFMGMFFLVAGYYTPGSWRRKGTTRFAADRLLRLGVLGQDGAGGKRPQGKEEEGRTGGPSPVEVKHAVFYTVWVRDGTRKASDCRSSDTDTSISSPGLNSDERIFSESGSSRYRSRNRSPAARRVARSRQEHSISRLLEATGPAPAAMQHWPSAARPATRSSTRRRTRNTQRKSSPAPASTRTR